MADIREATFQCDIIAGSVLVQCSDCASDASTNDIAMRRRPGRCSEGAGKVEAAHARNAREIGQRQRPGYTSLDEVKHAAEPTCRDTPSHRPYAPMRWVGCARLHDFSKILLKVVSSDGVNKGSH